jgi:putative zinc finger/helix-turn-helix YgiT family protein
VDDHSDVLGLAPSEAVECSMCGRRNVCTRIEREQFTYGEGSEAIELTAEVPVRHCSDCGFEFTDEVSEDKRHEAVCRHLGVLTPTEVVDIRKRYDLSRSEFARIARVGDASLARWENGLVIQNASIDQLLYLLTFPENLERLRYRRVGEPILLRSEVRSAITDVRAPRTRLRALEVTPAVLMEAGEFVLSGHRT